MNRVSVAIILSVLAASIATAQDVRLKPVARVHPDAPVTLADIATLSIEAQPYASVVVMEDPAASLANTRSVTLSRERVINAITTNFPNALSSLDIAGSECVIALRAASSASVQSRATSESPQRAPTQRAQPNSVQAAIEQLLANELAVTRDQLRVTFRDADREILETSLINRQSQIRATGRGDIMPIAVTLYEGERVVKSGVVRVDVSVQRNVAITNNPVPRGATVKPNDFSWERRWVRASLDPATIAALDAAIAVEAIPPGVVVTARHVQPPIAIRRGDPVTIHCLTGSLVIEVTATAREDGRSGDTIEFETRGADRRTIHARVSAPGVAVLRAGGKP